MGLFTFAPNAHNACVRVPLLIVLEYGKCFVTDPTSLVPVVLCKWYTLLPMHTLRVYGFLCSSFLSAENVVSMILLHLCCLFFVTVPTSHLHVVLCQWSTCSQGTKCVCTGSCAHRSWVRKMLCHWSYFTCAFSSLYVVPRRVTLKARACGDAILSRMALVYCLGWVQFIRCVVLWFGVLQRSLVTLSRHFNFEVILL